MYFLNLKFKIYGVIWKKNLELLLNDLNHCTLRVYVCVACVDGFDPTAPRLGPLSLPHIIEGFAVRRTVIPVCFCLSLEIRYRRQPAAVPHRRRRRRTTQPISRPHIEVSIHKWHRPPISPVALNYCRVEIRPSMTHPAGPGSICHSLGN